MFSDSCLALSLFRKWLLGRPFTLRRAQGRRCTGIREAGGTLAAIGGAL